MNPVIQLKKTTPLFIVTLAFFALSPQARAQCQQGCDSNNFNTFFGNGALAHDPTGPGGNNTAFGPSVLYTNVGGNANTGIGFFALYANTTGDANTAIGDGALENNQTGGLNTANGVGALYANTTGSYNTADGWFALTSNTTGNYNTANGYTALAQNTGSYNTASGGYALTSNTSGIANVAIGVDALYNNTIGSNNTAIGVNALVSSTGSNNVGLGTNAGHNLTTGSGNVCIGAGVVGVAGESNTTRIRNIYSSVASGRAVYVNSDNKMGTLSSSRRYKEEIKPMDKASETLFALKPVTFRYKKEVDAERALSFGLIAEDAAKVSPELTTRDEKGNPETVRYEAVNAMLLNEFLKEHRKVQELEASAARQQKQIEALTAGLQKVSAELEVRKAAPQMVLNNQ